MGKIDITKIEGFREDMTADEKLALYENYNAPEPQEPGIDASKLIKKDLYDKVASELAATKKALKTKMSDEEQKEAERIASQNSVEEELKTLRREKSISTYKASLLALGYDEKLANETSESLVDSDFEKVFANMAIHKSAHEKAIKAEALKDMPTPPAGGKPGEEDEKAKWEASMRQFMGLPPIKK